MKKAVYLFSIVFALALMSTSCCKPEDETPVEKTLSAQNPDWKNLSWVSTNGKDYTAVPAVYPRISVKIGVVTGVNFGEEVITITETKMVSGISTPVVYNYYFDKITLTASSVVFSCDPTGALVGNPLTYAITKSFGNVSGYPNRIELVASYDGNTYILQK